MSFPSANLSDVCDINPRMPAFFREEEMAAFLPMAAISEDGHIAFQEERPVREVKKGYTYFERGDVLVAKITPCFENGKAARTTLLQKHLGFGSTEFHVLRAGPAIDPSYLFHLVWNSKFRAYGAKSMTGSAGQKRVPADFLKRLRIPLPPLDEQRRIAAILDKADALRRKRKRALELIDTLTQSIFLEMFGDPFSPLPNDQVSRVDFEAVTMRITYGFTQPMSHLASGVPILTAKNVRMGFIDYDNVSYADRHEFDTLTAKSKPEKNDILITKDGAIGRSACVETDKTICINQSVALVKVKCELVEPLYLLAYLLCDSVQRRFDQMKKGNAIPHLQITELAKFPIPLPARSMQSEFVVRFKSLKEVKLKLERHLVEIEQLFLTLQTRAFSGQL